MAAGEQAQAFKVRFRDPRTRAALHAVADQVGVSMNEIADLAIERELLLRSAFVASDLEAAAAALRSVTAERYHALVARTDAAYASGEGRPELIQGRQVHVEGLQPLAGSVLDTFGTAFDAYPAPAPET